MELSRRNAIKAASAAALASMSPEQLAAAQVPAPPKEGKNTPKIAVGMGDGGLRGPNGDRAAAARRIKQLGVDHVLSGGPGALPWTERVAVDRYGAVERGGHSGFEPDDQSVSRHPVRASRR